MSYRARDEHLSVVLTEEEVADLIEARKRGTTIRELAQSYGIHRNTVVNIWNRYWSQQLRESDGKK